MINHQKTASTGYTITEVLISLWLLLFIGGALVATFAYIRKSGSVSADRAAAILMADEMLERASKAGPPDWGLDTLTGTSTIATEVGGDNNYDWSLEASQLESSSLGSLHKLELSLDWTNHQGGAERGKRSLVRSRLVYLRAR